MNAKRISAALVAVLVLGALAAGGASAAVKTVPAQWHTGAGAGTTLPVGTSKTVTATIATHPVIGAKFTFATTIATTPIDFTATGIECIGCKIQNKAVNGTVAAEPTTTSSPSIIAWGSGKMRFTGVTAMSPENCEVSNPASGQVGVVETKELVIHGDWMDGTEANQKAFIQFLPKAGPTTTFAQFHIEGIGCEADAGTYNVTGSLFGESVNNTGVAATTQNLVFSPAVQTTTGAQLKVGVNNAELTGTGAYALSPSESFQIK